MVTKKTSLSSFVFLIILIFELPIISILYVASPEYTDDFLLGFAVLLASLNSVVYFFVIKSEPSFELGYFKHSVFFLLGFLIVHFQYYAMYLVGIEDLEDISIWIDLSVINKSAFLSLMGYCSFLIGFILRKSFYSHKKTLLHLPKHHFNTKQQPKLIKSTSVSLLMTGVVISFFLFLEKVGEPYLSGSYAGTYNWGEGSTYYYILYDILLKAVILQRGWDIFNSEGYSRLSIKRFLSLLGFFPIMLLLLYLTLCVFTGDRGPLLTYGTLLVGCYLAIARLKVNMVTWGIGLFFASYVMGVLVTVRSMDVSESFFLRVQKTLFAEKSQEKQRSELASSVRCLHLAVEAVPSSVEYSKGLLQVYQLVSAVPGASAAFLVFGGYKPWDLESSTMISYWEGGAEFTSGSGSTSVADIYIDLGAIGVVVAFFIIGYLIQYMETSLYEKTIGNVFLWIVIMLYLSNALYLSRAALLFPMKEIVFVSLAVLFNKRIMSLFKSSK